VEKYDAHFFLTAPGFIVPAAAATAPPISDLMNSRRSTAFPLLPANDVSPSCARRGLKSGRDEPVRRCSVHRWSALKRRLPLPSADLTTVRRPL